MKTLKTVTPDNIESMSIDEILNLVEDKKGLPSKRNRYKVIEMVYKILGFDLSNDVLLALLKENDAQLCVATAGGGKTTFAQIKIVLEKLWRKSKNGNKLIEGNNILCLVYNKHNKRDMVNKQAFFVNEINTHTPPTINLDPNINACTMHAFCNLWANTYVVQMGLTNYQLMTDGMVESSFKNAIMVAKKKLSDDIEINVDDLVQLYNYHRETMLEVDQLTMVDKFIDLNLPVSTVQLIFDIFNSIKRTRRVYDFTDMLQNFYILIRDNKEILENIRSYYDYIVADEVQDFTPIMWKILQLLVDDGTPLLCIGDEDQNIYSFRGANIYDTLHFNDKFKDAETFVLSRNRRCRKEILDSAKDIIDKNNMRFSKSILGVKDGGKVDFIPYSSQKGEYLSVIKRLKNCSESELESTVIAYREKDSSAIFIEYLANADIPFYVISGTKPFSHELYKHLMNILDLMQMPADSNALLNLYKILPISKAENYKLLDYNPATFSFGPRYKRNAFYYQDFGQLYSRAGFSNVMQDLINISRMIDTEPLKNYFPKLFYYFSSYYWKFKKSNNDNNFDDLFEEYIYKLFNCDLTYDELSEQIQLRKDRLNRYERAQSGLAVSTFHGLKGLEFDSVILLNLDDDIFPNYSLIDSKEYEDSIKEEIKEAERRLFYVAITRARNDITFYYSEDNPSSFLLELWSASAKREHESKLLTKSKGATSKTDLTQSEKSFVPEKDLIQSEKSCLKKSFVFGDDSKPASQSDLTQGLPLNEGLDLDLGLSLDANSEQDLEIDSDIFYNHDEKKDSCLNAFQTDRDYKDKILDDLKDLTQVKVGPAVSEITHTDSVDASSLRRMHLTGLEEKEQPKKRDNFINRLFANY